MIRVVLDTNVIVSAHLTPSGPSARTLLLGLAKEYEICISPDVLTEYKEVLPRSKFRLDPQVIDEFLKALLTTAILVQPTVKIHDARDPDDDKFLECAAEANADYLVTWNLKDYPVPPRSYSPAKALRILEPKEFLRILDEL